MSVLKNFDDKQNFWQVNPHFKLLGAFKEFYKNDRSRGKEESSRIMWAVAFRLDPSENNIYRNLSDDDKCKYLAKDFLKNEKFDWDTYSPIIDFYKSMILTQAQKSLISWNEILEMRDKQLKGWYKEALKSKDIGLIVELDKIVALTAKFYQDYKKIKEDFDVEETAVRGSGNKIKSLTDSGEI
jgi:hypothetical protein